MSEGARLGRILREETTDSILGYEPPCGPQPVLLGRHRHPMEMDSVMLDQVKDRAAEARKHQLLRGFLLSFGVADVNRQKAIGRGIFRRRFTYPLHAAVGANDVEAAEALLLAGADRSLCDSEGLTPLDLAQTSDRRDSHCQ